MKIISPPARETNYRNRHLVRLLLIAVCVCSWVFSPVAFGEHEENHRYSIRGYVLDANQTPLSDVRISARLGQELQKSTVTNSDGYYKLRLHIHDTDIGKRLTVKAGADEGSIKMSAQRGNLELARIHHANFIGGKLVEGELDRGSLPGWILEAIAATVAVLVLIGVGVVLMRTKRPKQPAEAAAPGARKKSKRKKQKR